ncbi:MAG: ABC transporter permease [Planctomycetota bacterium]
MLRRLVAAVVLLLAVTFLTHLLVEWAPGDVLSELSSDPGVSRETLASLRRKFLLDRGPLERYMAWLGQAARGDLGLATNGQPVARLMGERVVNTLTLSLVALAMAWGVGVPLGVAAAIRPGSWLDRASALVAYGALSLPTVFLALLLQYLAARTHWFPIGLAASLDHDQLPLWPRCLDSLHHLALPAFAVAAFALPTLMRQMRASMIDILQQDYLRTARAKGMPERVVILQHALRNALNPMVTLLGYSIGALLNGAFLVEIVFAWPGMARLTVDGLLRQDEFVVKGSVVMASLMLLLGNTVADLLLVAVDPRVRVT